MWFADAKTQTDDHSLSSSQLTSTPDYPPEGLPPAPPDCPTAPRLLAVEFILPMSVLVVLNLIVLLGNALVIAAVFTHAKLRRTITNRFIVSLAAADMMVGLIVLPFSSANEVLRFWPFGRDWCSVWLAFDVWLCTSSIFNLCAISFDRYLAISRPFRYPHLMSPCRAKLLIVCVWILSFIICFPPLIGWNDRRRAPHDVSVGESTATLGAGQDAGQFGTWFSEGFKESGDVTADWVSKSDGVVLELGPGGLGTPHGRGFPVSTRATRNFAEQPSDWDSIAQKLRLNASYLTYKHTLQTNIPNGDNLYSDFSTSGQTTKSEWSEGVAYDNWATPNGPVPDCTYFATECKLTSDPGYIIYSACGSFWVPMLVMVVFYWKIYKTAAAATKALRRGFIEKRGKSGGCGGGNGTVGGLSNSSSENSLTLRVHRGGGGRATPTRASDGCIEMIGGGDLGAASMSPRFSFDDRSLTRRRSGVMSSSMANQRRVDGNANTRLVVNSSTATAGGFKQKLPKIVVTSTTSCEMAVDLDNIESPPDTSQLQHDRVRNDVNSNRQGVGCATKSTQQKNGAARPLVQNHTRAPASPRPSIGSIRDDVTSCSSRKGSLLSESGRGDQPQQARFSFSKTGQCLSNRLAHILPQLRSLNREKKAAKTVGVIVGCFIFCWAPFFTVYLFGAFFPDCTPALVFDVFFWLGYCNSAANPFIYGLCSRDFRYAFKKLLRCRCERKRETGRRSDDGKLATMLRSLRLQIVTRGADSYS